MLWLVWNPGILSYYVKGLYCPFSPSQFVQKHFWSMFYLGLCLWKFEDALKLRIWTIDLIMHVLVLAEHYANVKMHVCWSTVFWLTLWWSILHLKNNKQKKRINTTSNVFTAYCCWGGHFQFRYQFRLVAHPRLIQSCTGLRKSSFMQNKKNKEQNI